MNSEVSSAASVVLLGLGPTAASAYAALRERFAVVAVVRPQDDLATRMSDDGVEVISDSSLSAVETVVRRLRPDAVVVSSYDRVLPIAVLEVCPFVNVHYAPLPRYRGRANVNWMMINGERAAAVTIHVVAPGLDAGGVLIQRFVPIRPRDTVAEVYAALDAIQREELAEAVVRHLDGDPGVAQDAAAATYGCTRLPDDGEIDWSASTAAIDRLIRALGVPYPGAFTFLGLRRVGVVAAEPVEDAPVFEGRIPGRVIRVDRVSGAVDVLTGDGVLRIHRVLVTAGGGLEDGTGNGPGNSPGDGTATHARGESRELPAAEVVASVRSTLGLRPADLVWQVHELQRRVVELERELAKGPLDARD